MNAAQTGMKAHERLVPELDALLSDKRVQACWGGITSLDPMGMYASRPTIAATYAKMTIPELTATMMAEADGKIVDADGQINVIKCAVDNAWNLPAMADLLNYPEGAWRRRTRAV